MSRAMTKSTKTEFVALEPLRVFNVHQSWNATQLLRFKKYRVKVDVRRNAYDEQSHLTCAVWSPAKLAWSVVVDLPFLFWPPRLKHVSYVTAVLTLDDFGGICEGVEMVLARARLVLA